MATRIPVSNSLQLQRWSQLDHTVRVIDSVHSDGVLPRIPVKEIAMAGPGGEYDYIVGGHAVSISVATPVTANTFNLVHEVGHFLDHQAIDQPGEFASDNANSNLLLPWWNAVASSKEILTLEFLLQKNVDTGTIYYYLTPREIWARSYAQWVAQKSQDPTLMKELHQRRRGSWHALSQWEDISFVPISNAIDSVFATLGWI